MMKMPAQNMPNSPSLRAHEIFRGRMMGMGMSMMQTSVTRLRTRTVTRKAGLCGMQYSAEG